MNEVFAKMVDYTKEPCCHNPNIGLQVFDFYGGREYFVMCISCRKSGEHKSNPTDAYGSWQWWY